MIRLLISGQDPSLPGGMAQYVGGLRAYLETTEAVETLFLNETLVKGRDGMFSAGPAAAVQESGRLLAHYRHTLRQFRPDVVHLNMAHGLSVLEKTLMANVARRHGIPAVVHVHGAGMDEDIARLPHWQRRWMDGALRPPHRAIVLSERMYGQMQRHLPRVTATVVPNAVTLNDPPPLHPFPVFGFLGFMDGRKGEAELISAFAGLGDSRARLVLAGDGPARPGAQALADRIGIASRVTFLGSLDRAAKDAFLRSIDVLCLPSHAENLPIALLEAMSYGRPVIATRVGGIPEMVDEAGAGWLVPTDAPEALTSALREAFDNPAEVERRGRAAWATVRDRFTWSRHGPEVIKIYTALSEERQTTSPALRQDRPVDDCERRRSQTGYDVSKRIVDVGGALVLLLLCFPSMLVIGLLTVATSRGPVLFRQTRLGRHGVRFRLYKFRTMVVDAERQLADRPELRSAYEESYKLADDPRVTPFGAFLRRTSLDELPQLFNILGGRMSLIGPRPIVPQELAKYGEHGPKLLSVKPGLGGNWQAHGRSDTTYAQRIALDMHYIDHCSLAADLALLMQTALAVFRRRGSY